MTMNIELPLPLSPRPKRVLLAFLVAPLAGPLGISIGMMAPVALSKGEVISLIAAIPLFYLFATPVVYAFSLVLGPPAFLLLRHVFGLSRAGLITTWAIVAMLSWIMLSGISLLGTATQAILCIPFALGGAMVGYAFWWILSTDPLASKSGPTLETGDEPGGYLPKISEEDWR